MRGTALMGNSGSYPEGDGFDSRPRNQRPASVKGAHKSYKLVDTGQYRGWAPSYALFVYE